MCVCVQVCVPEHVLCGVCAYVCVECVHVPVLVCAGVSKCVCVLMCVRVCKCVCVECVHVPVLVCASVYKCVCVCSLSPREESEVQRVSLYLGTGDTAS